jgi:hypothetical protein
MSTSAPNINNVTLLTADPVLRELPEGESVCDLRLAVNDQRDKPRCSSTSRPSAPAPMPAPSTSQRAARSP